jgi:succinate dehydrogenase / fumarate reductase cytochrome b subunit
MARPVFFNLVQIQMPVGALTSITHRVTGIVLVLGIPYGVYLLDLSLQSPQSFAQLTGLFHQWPFKAAASCSSGRWYTICWPALGIF